MNPLRATISSFLVSLCGFASAGHSADSVPTYGSPYPIPDAVGLTLSGGGAKGIAHIGVIQALEENNIPVDCITGTSMGAIVGSLYAMGYSPAEMIDLIRSKPFQYWSTGKIDSDLTYYFLEPDPSPANVSVNVGKGGSPQSVLPSSLINPLPMNFAFMELFSGASAQCGGDFNRLMVPFRCVASDVNRKDKAVFSSGDLADCVRASMSFPMVFHPIEIDGRPMFDGGIYD
ncbi:MAG: patatin-like phospholipase family protein, partial [Paramuribaculum sp.]|nr:patatin-like phospholipase family protein [Paramuribaculum sp.]